MRDRQQTRYECGVCGEEATLHDVVDFNKSCREGEGIYLPLSGTAIYYARCGRCGFCFAPQMCGWTLEEFAERVYNDRYVDVDPDYRSARPTGNAEYLIRLLGDAGRSIRHLDYGGGHGLLSDVLRDTGWNSTSYDPFVDLDRDPVDLGRFDLITAFEVFEHVPDVRRLAGTLASLLNDDATIVFSTLVSDGSIAPHRRLDWWYASPRNGHISLFTRDSLHHLAEREKLAFASFNEGLHVFWRGRPKWATFLPQGSAA
ncbi:MAG: class I SAM-dependent methyltransferase [Burkholderiales bacterium]|nr:class I SAM-dependent methyltransferase [Burkholderiales bacterium]